jgi:hypothetical protein
MSLCENPTFDGFISECVTDCLRVLSDPRLSIWSVSPTCLGRLRQAATPTKHFSDDHASSGAWSQHGDLHTVGDSLAGDALDHPGRRLPEQPSAIQIDGDWTTPFATARPTAFTDLSGGRAPKNSITTWSYFGFYQMDSIDLIEIPYRNSSTALRIIVDRSFLDPRERICKRLLQGSRKWLYSALPTCYLALTLPTFGVEDVVDLTTVNCSESPRGCYRVKMGIFPLGSTPRTAMDPVMIGSAHPPELDCVVDRPFFWAVVDRKTGDVPAMGLTLDPNVALSLPG